MESEKIGFALLALDTEQFATFEENLIEEQNSDFSITTSLEFKVNTESKQIGVFTTFTFEQSNNVLIKIQISIHFGISPSSWEIFSTKSEIVFPKDFLAHLVMIAIGSARGILHVKTEGTKLNKFLLPTIDVTRLVIEDVKFPIAK